MTPGHPPPAIKCAFRDYRSDDACRDLVAEGEFFIPDEFQNADHHFVGEFDEYGQYRGVVSIYGDTTDYVLPWPGARGVATQCGPFRFSMADVMGKAVETTIPFEEHGRLTAKMDRIGGIYIYRDGIRVLPYGDNDFDWLDIERNRTKGAGYYHFSYRRVFGVVEICHEKNPDLSEKAGREGFRANTAYRQLRSILQNFLEHVAADFFRDGGTRAQAFAERKDELNRQSEARKRREEHVRVKRKQFDADLAAFSARYEGGKPQEDAQRIVGDTERELRRATGLADPVLAAEEFLRVEDNAARAVSSLVAGYRVRKPRIGLPTRLEREWAYYAEAFGRMEEKVFRPARERIESLVAERAQVARIEVDRRRRFEKALRQLEAEARSGVRSEKTQTEEALDRVISEVRHATVASVQQVEAVVADVLVAFNRLDVARLPDAEAVAKRDELERRLIGVKEKEESFLQFLREQLDGISVSEDGRAQLDQLEALEQRAQTLEEQAETDLQLAQLGMALDIINHEFESNIRSIRENLRRLKAWADVNKGIEQLYESIRASFDHLDGYLTLFTPLHRRLYRKEVEIAGADIAKFLSDLFSERLRRHGVELVTTKAFSQRKVIGYPSSFYPVFVNLVDNAIFWLSARQPPKSITLDSEGDAFVVRDTGPGVAERDRAAVFEYGFTRKPGGRGMGLFISMQVLGKIGWELLLDPRDAGAGAGFRLQPVPRDAQETGGNEA
jgi:signal transduction histidine kinase